MVRQVTNYQDLQDTVRDYLNRTDLDERIEQFIFFAERKIFRWYRNHNNEKLIAVDMRRNPDTAPESTEVLLGRQLDLPSDYLETLALQAFSWDPESGEEPPAFAVGKPLQRVSQQEFLARTYRRNKVGQALTGEPEIFARIRDALFVHPAPETDTYYTWQYYCDLSGLFDTPTSDNNVLKTAPDLYVYGSLMEAEPFLKTEEEVALLPIWKGMYEEAKQQIKEQTDMELYSGSVTEVQGAFGSPGQASQSSVRSGWA